MSLELLDNPFIHSILFHPRRALPSSEQQGGVLDGTIPVGDDERLGYRLYTSEPSNPVVVFFHGNGEIAPDYDGIAPMFQAAGASLLVIDFRGYGWSTGEPSAVSLVGDMSPLFGRLGGVTAAAGLSGKWILMGRSLGSICAIEMAYAQPEGFAGLIIESGLAYIVPLLARLGLPSEMVASLPDPVGNARKMREVDLPLLVIHGERDQILPVGNGQALYDASPAEDKRLLRVSGAGHNDLLFVARNQYFDAVTRFISDVTGSNGSGK